MKKLLYILLGLIIVIGILISWQQISLQKGIAAAGEEFANYEPPMIRKLGTVEKVSILPLVDWHAASPEFRTEMGVSYLVKAGDRTILFDMGYNAKEEDPSPLQYNMKKLGIEMNEIDMIVISHNHFDHVGGKKWVEAGSFSPGNEQIGLGVKQIFTPIDMTYPGQQPVTTRKPTVLDSGIATIGTIPRQLIIGKIDEQSLAINIEGKGLLLIVGCSHQTIPKIIKRTRDVFSEPIYGILGGLHFPVPEGRLKLMGGLIDGQRWASGNGPFDPINREDVERNIQLLKDLDIQVVGVGGHDSSDEVIELFRKEFGEKYRDIKVGKEINI